MRKSGDDSGNPYAFRCRHHRVFGTRCRQNWNSSAPPWPNEIRDVLGRTMSFWRADPTARAWKTMALRLGTVRSEANEGLRHLDLIPIRPLSPDRRLDFGRRRRKKTDVTIVYGENEAG